MVFRITFLVSCLSLLMACSSTKEQSESKGRIVVFNFCISSPHCGGAPPQKGVEYPTVESYSGYELAVYDVKENGSRGKFIRLIKTDEDGMATCILENGKYQLWNPTKLLSFEDFVAKNRKVLSENYEYDNEECFRNWYDQPDHEINLIDQERFSFVYKSKCYVGLNPCMTYVGPPAP